jgi:hypothetical protein
LLGKHLPRLDLALAAMLEVSYLRENGITQVERLAGAHAIELRLPLLDNRFVEKA